MSVGDDQASEVKTTVDSCHTVWDRKAKPGFANAGGPVKGLTVSQNSIKQMLPVSNSKNQLQARRDSEVRATYYAKSTMSGKNWNR